MINSKKIEHIARQFDEYMPKSVRKFGEEVDKKLRKILEKKLARLGLVNRSTFDLQAQALLRTREHLDLLEQRIAGLESSSNAGSLDKQKEE